MTKKTIKDAACLGAIIAGGLMLAVILTMASAAIWPPHG
jgi:hypothetical protein